MKLIELKLENFQGIKALTLTPGGEDIEIRGDNATGKTTLGNAITWLLYGKPLTDEKGFSPKTLDSNGAEVHNLTHGVDATFENNGEIIQLKKEFKEIWTKKRGTAKNTFSGHTTDYYLNEIPVKESEFTKRIEQICDPERAKILTNPFYFPGELKWNDRRSLLLSVCGDISDDDVIASNKEIALLTTILANGNGGSYPIDDFIKKTKGQMTAINNELASTPSRIDEAEKAKPETENIYRKVFEKEVEDYEGDLRTLETEKLNMENGQVDSTLFVKKSELNKQYSEEYSKYSVSRQKEKNEQVEALSKSAGLVREADNYIKFSLNNFNAAEQKIQAIQKTKQELTGQYKAVKAETWTGSTECPTCGQALPEDKIQEAVAAFNLNKSNRLEKINKQATESCSKNITEKAIEELKNWEMELAKSEAEFPFVEKDHETALSLAVEIPEFETTEISKKLKSAIKVVDDKINAPAENQEEIKRMVEEINATKEKISGLKRKLMNLDMAEVQEARIEELKAQEETLSAEYEKLEGHLFLCEQFIKTKVSLLTESINQRFKNVRFKLFEDQINGGLKEACEVLVPCAEGLVPFASANNAGRINAGIEIIDALSEYWGIEMPLIVDNAESVVELFDTKLQVIKLVVDGQYKKLQINGGK